MKKIASNDYILEHHHDMRELYCIVMNMHWSQKTVCDVLKQKESCGMVNLMKSGARPFNIRILHFHYFHQFDGLLLPIDLDYVFIFCVLQQALRISITDRERCRRVTDYELGRDMAISLSSQSTVFVSFNILNNSYSCDARNTLYAS